MQRSLAISTAAVLGGVLGVGSAALAASPPASVFPITRTQVTGTVRRNGFPSDPAQVRLAARVVASVAQPHLEIVSITATSAQLRVRLACAVRAECLPFFATVDMPSQAAASRAEEKWLAASAQSKDTRHSMKPAAVHNGSRLTMLLDSDHLHIKMPVISLGTGNPGETVRVAGLGRTQTYAAQVVDDHIVRGELP